MKRRTQKKIRVLNIRKALQMIQKKHQEMMKGAQ